MAAIDWTIVVGLLAFITWAALGTRRYTASVADFLSANRCAGRYLLCIAGDLAGIGAISIIAGFEMVYRAGFVANWWGQLAYPLWMAISLSGWIIYRFRQTRALTMPQFLEMRYSKRFRVFFGIMGWAAGMATIGIVPAVAGRFFLYYCGLPPSLPFAGAQVPTLSIIMVVLLAMALFYTFMGGAVAVMVIDFLQGMFCNVTYLVLLATILWLVPWGHVIEAMQAQPPGESMLNPYKTDRVEDFDIWFFLIQNFVAAYMYMTWQGSQGFNTAAKSPHEARMSRILGTWRGLVEGMLRLMLPLGAFAVMHHAGYERVAEGVRSILATISGEQVRTQMTVPVVLSQILPPLVKGLFCAVILCAFIGSANSYLHSFGSIMVQDVILPFRRSRLSTAQHLRWLRGSIVIVAVAMVLLSHLYRHVDYIYMFLAAANAIFCGAGAAIIGGLYSRRGTTAGAWGAMILGGGVALGGILIQQFWREIAQYLLTRYPGSAFLLAHQDRFPINGNYVSLIAVVVGVLAYVGFSAISLAWRRSGGFDLDRMLHRGAHAESGHADGKPTIGGLRSLLPTAEFTKSDKVIYYASMGWMLLWFVVFCAATIINLCRSVSEEAWATYWLGVVVLTVTLGAAATLWFLVGGLRDMRGLYRALRTAGRDADDDGTVKHDATCKKETGDECGHAPATTHEPP